MSSDVYIIRSAPDNINPASAILNPSRIRSTRNRTSSLILIPFSPRDILQTFFFPIDFSFYFGIPLQPLIELLFLNRCSWQCVREPQVSRESSLRLRASSPSRLFYVSYIESECANRSRGNSEDINLGLMKRCSGWSELKAATCTAALVISLRNEALFQDKRKQFYAIR